MPELRKKPQSGVYFTFEEDVVDKYDSYGFSYNVPNTIFVACYTEVSEVDQLKLQNIIEEKLPFSMQPIKYNT